MWDFHVVGYSRHSLPTFEVEARPPSEDEPSGLFSDEKGGFKKEMCVRLEKMGNWVK